MELKVKDNYGKRIEIGDRVRILKITDDSGMATDLYGVEPQLNGWIDITYVEPFEGYVWFDEVRLMVVIRGKYRDIPLSETIRNDIWNDVYERLKKDDLEDVKKEFELADTEYETLINYLVKIN